MNMKRKIAGILAVLFLAVSMVTPVSASQTSQTGSEAVNEARNGVLQINLTYIDQNSGVHVIQGGTGFLIGDETGAEYMITNYHVVNMNDEVKNAASEVFGVDFGNLSNINLQIQVVVKRDVVINATIVNQSADMDFAILRLEQIIYDRTPLPIDDADEDLVETMDVYALGFPSAIELVEDTPFYVSSDVSIINGIVSTKTSIDGIKYIRHGATMTEGNSGGPLVNKDGYVVGVNTLGVDDTYFYSLQISEVTAVLNALGITYTSSSDGGSAAPGGDAEPAEAEGDLVLPEEPEVPQVDKTALSDLMGEIDALDLSSYSEASSKTLNDAVANGQIAMNNAAATQEEIDAAVAAITEAKNNLAEKGGIPMALIIGIAAAIVVVAVIIVMLSKSRKPAAESGRSGSQSGNSSYTAGSQSRANNVSTGSRQGGGSNMPSYGGTYGQGSSGSGETSLLDSGSDATSLLGSGETSLLGGGASAAATLVRTKNGEQIQIRKQVFKIGKERVKVDYCITDNNTISRVHAQIVYRDNEYYITDNQSKNFTYVNGNKLMANQEMKLRNGDKIKLSDEEFEFRC